MTAPKLTDKEWREIQAKWEGDPRPGYKWLVEELNLHVSSQAVGKRARRKGKEWKKVDERKWEAGELQKRVKVGVGKPKKPETDKNHGDGGNEPPEDGNVGSGKESNNLPANTDNTKRGRGQPTAYRAEYAYQVFKLCLLGMTQDDIADFFGVCTKTIDNWKNEHPEFLRSIRNGRHAADAEVANSMYLNACGYSHDAVHVSVFMGEVTLTNITKHYPPNFQAGRLWLMNRQPKLWKEKVPPPIDVDNNDIATDEELAAIREESMRKSREAAQTVIGRGERLGLTIDQVSDGD